MSDLIKETLMTAIGRVQYPSLDPNRPKLNQLANDGAGALQWEITLLFDPKDPGFVQFHQQLAAIHSRFVAKHGSNPNHKIFKFKEVGPFSNSKMTRPNPPDIIGMKSLQMTQNVENKSGTKFPPPQLFNAKREQIHPGDVYGGCYARALIQVREFEYKPKDIVISRGLTMDLKAVQFVRDGEPFAGGMEDYANYFDDLDGEVSPVSVLMAPPPPPAPALVQDI